MKRFLFFIVAFLCMVSMAWGDTTYIDGQEVLSSPIIDTQLTIDNGADSTIFQTSHADGTGEADARIILNDARPFLFIGDSDTVSKDFGIADQGDTFVFVANDAATAWLYFKYNIIKGDETSLSMIGDDGVNFLLGKDLDSGHAVRVDGASSSVELTDTDDEQSMFAVYGEFAQTLTAAGNGVAIRPTWTSNGDGSTGYGNNNLLVGCDADPDQFRVTKDGNVGQSNTGAFYTRYSATATASITAAATITINVDVPNGARILACDLRVMTALAAGETWDAEWNDGATVQSIATNQAVAKNTNLQAMFDPNANAPIADAETDIIIQKNSNPGVDAFSAQGSIRAVVFYETISASDAAS